MPHGETRVVLVTGGTRGIGAAAVARFLAAGHRVATLSRSGAGAVGVGGPARPATPAPPSDAMPWHLAGDVTDPAAVKVAVAGIVGAWGRLDILVHAAGVTGNQLLGFMDEPEWDRVSAPGPKALYQLCRAALPEMISRRWGRIVVVASLSAVHGIAGQTHYAAAKAGMVAFIRSLAKEVGRYNVLANAVLPGFVETAMTEGLSPEQRDGLVGRTALRRAGTADEVAAVIAFLASEENGYVTGAEIRVDGGA